MATAKAKVGTAPTPEAVSKGDSVLSKILGEKAKAPVASTPELKTTAAPKLAAAPKEEKIPLGSMLSKRDTPVPVAPKLQEAVVPSGMEKKLDELTNAVISMNKEIQSAASSIVSRLNEVEENIVSFVEELVKALQEQGGEVPPEEQLIDDEIMDKVRVDLKFLQDQDPTVVVSEDYINQILAYEKITGVNAKDVMQQL